MTAGVLADVAIIGGGLGGCALALALSAHKIHVTVYEARLSSTERWASGVLLTPNGLRVLDRLGVFSRIADRCYKPTHYIVKNDKDETINKRLNRAEELTGYANHRLWRAVLSDEMKKMLSERGVHIRYGSKFNGIVSDDRDGVTFLINDTKHTASMLIGSDGVNSIVRKHLAGDVESQYTGVSGVISHVKYSSIDWPYADYEHNGTIQDKPGALFFISEDAAGEDIMVGIQAQYPEQSRQELEALAADKDRLLEFFRKDYDKWGTTARKLIDGITANKEGLIIWPYANMPKLPRWFSDSGRVILVGDGAHAVPPSSGQGVNQALEDVLSLTMLLAAFSESSSGSNDQNTGRKGVADLHDALSFWQALRQDKIDQVIDWATNVNNIIRLPEAERQRLIAEGKVNVEKLDHDTKWLFDPNVEDQVNQWILQHQ